MKVLDRHDVALVSCVKKKRRDPCAAKDLYVSDRFKKSRLIAESCAGRWFILSALHGFLDPDEIVRPYEQTLKGAKAVERHKWAEQVLQTLCERIEVEKCHISY